MSVYGKVYPLSPILTQTIILSIESYDISWNKGLEMSLAMFRMTWGILLRESVMLVRW